MVCLRNISINTLLKGDKDKDNNNNNNNNHNITSVLHWKTLSVIFIDLRIKLQKKIVDIN
jgi:hypothetical protein